MCPCLSQSVQLEVRSIDLFVHLHWAPATAGKESGFTLESLQLEASTQHQIRRNSGLCSKCLMATAENKREKVKYVLTVMIEGKGH